MNRIQTDHIFGNYIIKQKLGSGGMATVYHAIHSQSNQTVALKILHEHYADDVNIRKRLEHEAQIAMRLEHPYIVPVWDYGEIENRPYLVMPYLSGGSLAALFQQPRTIKHEASLNLLAMLATALDYAHSQQVVHRDFKLENILLDENKIPAISDFGIAQSANTTRITMTGQILGTPQYLAPENIDDKSNLNYKADLYALGVVAYVLLTGYFPFTASDPVSLLVKHRTETAPLASWVNSNLPTTVDSIFVRALAKNPRARFPNAQSFIEALDKAFVDSPVVTTMVHLNAQNPVFATVAAPMPAQNPPAQTGVFEADIRRKSGAQANPTKGKSRKRFAIAFLSLLICGATSALLLLLNMNMFSAGAAETMPGDLTEEAANALLALDTETATASPSPTPSETPSPSPSPTVTPSITPTLHPSMSPSPTFTASPTFTPSPTNTRSPFASPTASLTASRTPTSVPQSGGGGGAPEPGNTRRPTLTRTPTATLTPTRTPTRTPSRTPTRVPSNTPVPPTATAIPPTAIPPTAIPPTDIPPTAIPPTDIPPTAIPPTDIPPTDIPPTDPPPPPTDPPPPPTDEPPTEPPSEEGTDEG